MLYFRRGLHAILIRIIIKQTAEVNQVFPTTYRVTGSFMASRISSTIDRKCNHLNLNSESSSTFHASIGRKGHYARSLQLRPGLYIQESENNQHFNNHNLVWASIQRGGSGLGFESTSEVLLQIKNISIGPVDTLTPMVDIPAELSPTTDHSSPLVFSTKASLLCSSTTKQNSVTLLSTEVSVPPRNWCQSHQKVAFFAPKHVDIIEVTCDMRISLLTIR